MPTNITVPLKEDELDQILNLIQANLSPDEAGPAFFIATPAWEEETEYEEVPF